MKLLGLFIAILAGTLAARRVTDSNPRGFVQAVADSITELEMQTLAVTESAVESVKESAAIVVDAVRYAWGTPYDALIESSALASGIPPDVLYRLLYQESRFRPDIISGKVTSPTGAMGIAQFMPATAREWLGSEAAALDPNIAIPGAARYLAYLRKYFNGDLTKAVASYNWGMGNVSNRGLDKAPKETRNYVSAILPGTTIG